MGMLARNVLNYEAMIEIDIFHLLLMRFSIENFAKIWYNFYVVSFYDTSE